MIRCILFDRDGTLGDLQDNRYPQTFRPFCSIPDIFAKIKERGYYAGIITNQSSIARGTGASYDFAAEFETYGCDVWEICPHDTGDGCDCRKPKSGMLLSAAKRLGISPSECIVVGDRLSDIQCAKQVGGVGILVLTGQGKNELFSAKQLYPDLTVLPRFDEILTLLNK